MSPDATGTLPRLRGLSDAMLMLVAQIETTESQKRELPSSHPMFLALSTEVVQLAAELYDSAKEEEAAAWRASEHGGLNGYDATDMQVALEDWTAVREALRIAEPGTAEAQRLRDVATAVRRQFLDTVRKPDATAET